MARRRRSVQDLAREAGLDLDEALVALWDVGIDTVDTGRDEVPAKQMPRAYGALGLTAPREAASVDYWVKRTGLSPDALRHRARDAGVEISATARRLPKGGARRLARLFPAPGAESAVLDLEPVPPFRWEIVGAECDVRVLTEDEVLRIHELLEEDFASSSDPIWPLGVKNQNLLSSACSRPHTALGQTRKYPTVEMATAALFHSLALNHAFHNGNKRTALVALLAQLDENGLVLTASQEDLFRFTLKTAQHGHVPRHADELADREVITIATWIKSNSRDIAKGERPMKWIRLQQRLAEHNCTWEPAGGVGNRLNICRTIPGKKRFGITQRSQVLSTQVACAGSGSEADRNTIHKIRRDLQLDDEHDIDSASFYAGAAIDSFIIDYRRILARLAKL
jgi:death-on-curing family protein